MLRTDRVSYPLVEFIGVLALFSATAGTLMAQTAALSPVVISNSQSIPAGVSCPQCGQLHGTVTSVSPVQHRVSIDGVSSTVYTSLQPTPQQFRVSGSENVLAVLNGQRSRQGLPMLRYDRALQAVAGRRAQQMASMGTKSHPPGSFAPGRYEGVGWSSSFSPSGVYACYTSDPNMTAAGAAMVRGHDGVYFAVVYR